MSEENSKFGTFPRKWARVLENLHEDDKFLEDVQQFSTEEMDKQIVTSNEIIAEMKKNMELDSDLQAAKQNVKDIASNYTEGIKINEAKAMYCVYLKNSL